jgi:hypothetical protein
MRFWEALAIGFRRLPGPCDLAPYEKLSLCSCHQSQIASRCECQCDLHPISDDRPSILLSSAVDDMRKLDQAR